MLGGGTGNEMVFSTIPFAALALAKSGQHARIILIGGQHLVARLQIDPVLRDFQRFAGVAGDGNFLRIAAGVRASLRRTVSTWGSRLLIMVCTGPISLYSR